MKNTKPDAIFYEAKMFSRFTANDLTRLMGERGWEEMEAVRNGHVFLTPSPLDFLAHHGPSFITEAIPWLRDRLETVPATSFPTRRAE